MATRTPYEQGWYDQGKGRSTFRRRLFSVLDGSREQYCRGRRDRRLGRPTNAPHHKED